VGWLHCRRHVTRTWAKSQTKECNTLATRPSVFCSRYYNVIIITMSQTTAWLPNADVVSIGMCLQITLGQYHFAHTAAMFFVFMGRRVMMS
jgi:hypothetical protein